MKLFSFDSPVMQAISAATDYVVLNLLCIVCSLPLITAGAAMSAKYYVGMKMRRGEEPAVFRSFFKSFISNLKQTILPSIAAIAIMLFLAYDWHLVINAGVAAVYKWLLFIITLLFMMVVFCFFPIIARYEISTAEAVKTAIGMAGARFPRVFLAIICFVLPIFVGLWYFKWAWVISLGAQTVMLYYNSGFFVKEFDRLEEKLMSKGETAPETESTAENATDISTENTNEYAADSSPVNIEEK